MTLGHQTIWVLTSLLRLDWAADLASRLAEAGERRGSWVDGTVAYRGIHLLDVLAPLTKRRSGAEEA
jgi:hypothetical protein